METEVEFDFVAIVQGVPCIETSIREEDKGLTHMAHGAFQWPLRTFLLTVAFQFLAGNSFATSLLASHEYLGTDRFLMLGDTLWGELVGTVITPDSRRRGYDELVDGIAGIRHFNGLVEGYGLSARL